jgi:hypothetical protein
MVMVSDFPYIRRGLMDAVEDIERLRLAGYAPFAKKDGTFGARKTRATSKEDKGVFIRIMNWIDEKKAVQVLRLDWRIKNGKIR